MHLSINIVRLISGRMRGTLLFLAVVAVCCTVMAAPRTDSLPTEMRDWGMQAINLVYEEDFTSALDFARRIVKKYPDHPAGYFFSAAALDSWMAWQQSDGRENDFYQLCDQAVKKGETMLSHRPDDPWVQFFVGGAEGLKGSYETRYERWITAFRYGWRGVSILKDLQTKHPEIVDVDYGVGTYDYWRSAMTKVMFWLPGAEDKRDAGIGRLLNARNRGLFTRMPAAANLVAILNNEKRYADLLALADEMLKPYPRSLVFHWGRGWALHGLGRFAEAQQEFVLIGTRLDAEQGTNHYMQTLCQYWLAKTYLALKDAPRCIAACDRMGSYKLADPVRKRLDRYFSDAAGIRRTAGK